MRITSAVEILENPKKFPSDRKNYKLIKLENGLKALLIKKQGNCKDIEHNDTISYVALCIDVGSFEDPFEVQGLCHFLEHMVFMGSEKFPKENEFDQYIKSRNGFDNAMTECEFTIFYFKVDTEHLHGALERFANFFISPLMSLESMFREMEAVESEFQNNVNNDVHRVNQLFASMVRDTHPASYFTWGNHKTLKTDIALKDLYFIVHEFRKRFYKSNRMNLCIQTSLGLEAQQRMVCDYFSEIKPQYRTYLRPLSFDVFADIFTADFYRKMYYVKSKTKKRKMFMTFILPTIERSYKNVSLEYLAFLINNQGRESLNSYFRRKSLASLVAVKIGSRNFEGNSMFTFFTIEVNLTRDGYENLEQILDAIFSFLLIIKMTSLGEHKEIYDEFKEIRDIQFNYHKEKHSLENVQELAINMKYFKDDDIIIGKEFCPEIDEMTLKDFIEKINERKFNLMILSHDYPRYDQTEQWFGTEYAKIDFPCNFTKLWNERWIRKEFSLPRKNRFICRNFEIVSEPDLDHEKPLLMFQNDFCKSFFKPDTKFRLPHGFVYIHFRCNLTESSISNLNMTSIYSMCIKNFLTETFYPATVAGYSYKLNSVDDGLILKLNGFSEKLPQLVEAIMNAIRSTNESIDISVFEAFAKELKKNCYNFLINSNFLSEELRLNIIKPNHMFYFNRFKDADKISYSKFKEFLAMLFKCVNVRILIQGNFSKCQALQITEKILSHFNDEKISYKIPEDANACQIPTEASYLRVKSFLPHDQNSVIKNYYQVGGSTMESECLLELLVKIMKEPLFNYIRTEQQLGYSVICLSKKDKNVIGMTITVETQEKKNSARIVDEKIESFLKNFIQNLTNIDEKDFEMLKKSIINHKRISVDDLETEVNFNWNEIRKNSLMFDRNDIEARQMELLTKNDLVTFYYDHFQGNYVRKLSIQVISNTDDNDSLLHHGFLHLNLISDENHKTISDVMKYKHSLAPCV